MRGGRVNADANVFFALWLQKPLRIAAANPSGARLADAVARCIDLKRPGPVLELGAGTGSLTQGLVRAGCPPERIIALESEPALVAVRRRESNRRLSWRVRSNDSPASSPACRSNGSRLRRNTPSCGHVWIFWDQAG